MQLKIGYVLGDFPKLSESFIMNEVIAIINLGVETKIFSLSKISDEVVHEEVEEYNLLERTSYVSETPPSRGEKISCVLRNPVLFSRIVSCPLSLRRKIGLFPHLIEISNLVEALGLDLFHAHFATIPAIVAMYLSKISNIPYTFTTHAYDIFKNTDKALLKQLCREAAGIVTISEYNRDFLVNIGADPSKVQVIRCGINLEKFQRKKPYGLHQKSLLCVARLVKKKGIRYLLMAMRLLRKEHPALEINIVGRGPEEGSLRELTRELGLQKNVHFLGSVSDAQLMDLYESSSIFVLPCIIANDGDRDGIPIVLMEAMAMELPVVSTSVSGIPELITDGKEGLLISQRDSRSLAKALEKLIEEPDLRKKLGSMGRKRIKEEFNIERTSRKLLDFFYQIAGG